MATDLHIFDRTALALKKRRFSRNFHDFNFLHEYAMRLICERLEDITHDFPKAVYMGRPVSKDYLTQIQKSAKSDTMVLMDAIAPHQATHFPAIIGDEEFFPFAGETLDLVIGNLSLHQTNDLPGSLIQIRRALRPDGLFVAAAFGGETLWQLREALGHAEQELMGGLSPRIHPFADKQQMGALMQRAGYALPVVDSELITVTYPNIFKLMTDLRGMGESNVIRTRNKAIPPRNLFHEAGTYYAKHFSDDQGQIEATFEMIFLIGWAPSETQQKPLRPGSAEKSLAEALGTTEIGAGEKAGS